MLTVSPISDRTEVARLFAAHDLPLTEDSLAVGAKDGDAVAGCGLFTLKGLELTLLAVDYPADDPILCDLITRAVMNYGANRGALDCALGENAPKDALLSLGFLEREDQQEMNIRHVFTTCTHCHHK